MLKIRNTDLLFHAWANKAYPDAECGKVSYRGNLLYSYAACISALLPSNAVAHSYQHWTPTTKRHQAQARSATSNRKRVYCYKPEESVAYNMMHARRRIADLLDPVAPIYKKDGKTETLASVKKREERHGQAFRIAEEANDYWTHAGDTMVDKIDIENLDGIREAFANIKAEAKRQEEAREVERQEAKKRMAAEAVETLVAWRKHECHAIFHHRLQALPPALRLSKDNTRVETSHGAEIPLAHALGLWPWVKRAKKVGKEITPEVGTKLGHYTLNVIKADGTIVVGCHTIAYSELEQIAKQLNLEV